MDIPAELTDEDLACLAAIGAGRILGFEPWTMLRLQQREGGRLSADRLRLPDPEASARYGAAEQLIVKRSPASRHASVHAVGRSALGAPLPVRCGRGRCLG